jgi:hypothetical protein
MVVRQTASEKQLANAELILEAIKNEPKYFFTEFLNADPWDKQVEIIKKLDKHQRVAVKSSNSCGKTWLIARIALRFLIMHPGSKVINTAPSFKQVENQYWRELRKAHKESDVELGGKLLKTQLNFDDDWFAMGVASGEHQMENFQGWHGDHILFIVDEASGVPDSIFEAIEGSMANANAKLLIVGNPTKATGYFADAFKGKLFAQVSMNAFDIPNVIKGKELIPGLATKEWVEYMGAKYGVTSDIYRVRVRGMFPSKDAQSLIGIDLIEGAMHNDRKPDLAGQEYIGVDVARFGDDRTTWVWRHGNSAKILKTVHGNDTHEVAEQTIKFMDQFPGAKVHIDIIGVGGGVFDSIKHWEKDVPDEDKKNYRGRVYGVNVSKKPKRPKDRKEYFNERSRGWDLVRIWLKTGILEYNQDWDELAQPRYEYRGDGREMKIESKVNLKKRIKKSPDVADALILTFQDAHEYGGPRSISWI